MVLAEMRRMGLLRGPDRLGRCYLLPAAAGIRGRYVTGEAGGSRPADRESGAAQEGGRAAEQERPRVEQARLF